MLLNCVVGEDSWEFLNCTEIRPVSPNGNQSWIFTGRTDAEAEAPIIWLPNAKIGLVEMTLMLWRIEGRRRGGQDEMLAWHHRPDGHEFEQAPAVGAGQGCLACCSRGVTKSWTWVSNWTELITLGPQIIGGNSLSWINSLVNLMDLKNPLAM